jgi:4-carboxymuconolactone decarboxylase
VCAAGASVAFPNKHPETSFTMTIYARIGLPNPLDLPESDQNVIRSIVKTRGNLDGPFLAWLHSPEFARRAERLGAFCRYETQLSTIESEFLILSVAAHFRCIAEWQIHQPIALRAGLSANTIELIRTGGTFELSESRLQVLHAFASDLLSRHRIREEIFAIAKGEFSSKELVEIVGVLGYYTLVAMTLNSFEMHLDEMDNPFD